jgi:hypothetical protein
MTEKTVAQKMYLKTARSLAVFNGAANPGVMAQLPPELISTGDTPVDVVLLFAQNQRQLAEFLPQALARLGDKGSLWIAFLKHNAAKATDLDRERISAYAKDFGVSVVAIISLDFDWSALRLKRL